MHDLSLRWVVEDERRGEQSAAADGCLEQVAGLTRAQRELERSLNDAAGTLLGDNKASRVREAEQRDQLVQLVNAQAGEIESLKGEILLLRSKGAQLFAG